MLLTIFPLYREFGISTILVSTYQAVSGAGRAAMHELDEQTKSLAEGKKPSAAVFPFQIAHNVLSHDSPVGDDGYNGEESKIRFETRKILDDPDIAVSATCIRVPVMRAHTESIYFETKSDMPLQDAQKLLSECPYLVWTDDPETGRFPMPLESEYRNDILVGRLRQDPDKPNGFWIMSSGDQLRRSFGARR